jgi:putative endonuclease
MYEVYIIQSTKDKSWYYGFSGDVEKRLKYHNEGRSTYTRGKKPWEIIFRRSFAIKADALNFEKYLKKSRNKEYIRKAYPSFFI